VLVTGGYGSGYSLLSSAELYDPATGKWSLTGPLNTARNYHSANLLPNGMLLIIAGFDGSGAISSSELYDVGLGFTGSSQPNINAIISPLKLGNAMLVTGSQLRGISRGSGSYLDSASDQPLVQLFSIEGGQTMFLLSTNWTTNYFASTAVWNFPSGCALATVFVNGIQSTSSIVNISVPVPTEFKLTGATKSTNGPFSLTFTNSVGAIFGVLATTNLSLPQTNWTALGSVTEVSPGQFQFADTQATNNPQRFYEVRSP